MSPAALTPTTAAADPRRRAAAALWAVATALLAALPFVMVIAHRSSPLVLALAAAAALGAAALEGTLGVAAAAARQALSSRLGLAAFAFLAYAALSITWSDVPAASLAMLGEFVIPLAAGFMVALLLSPRLTRRDALVAAVLAFVAACLIIAELQSGLTLRRALGLRFNSFIFNRPTLTLVLLAIPLLPLLMSVRHRLAALALAAATGLVLAQSDSAAAVLGAGLALGTYAVTRLAPRLALGLAGFGLLAALAAAPIFGDLAARILPPSLHAGLAEHHSGARVEIWRSFGAAIRAQPILGAGFGTSGRLHETAVAEAVEPQFRTLLAAGHPHNAFIQVWTELGAIGAGLAALVGLALLRALSSLSAVALAPRLALLAAVASVGLVGHGVWQGWWAAGIGAAIVWLRAGGELTGQRA